MSNYSNRIYTYIPERIKVYIDAYEVSGLLNISVSKDQETFKTIRGIRGKNTRVRQKDQCYTIKLELQQVDPVNDFLTDVHYLDTDSGGVGYMRIVIKDLNGTTRFSSDTAYIEKIPDFSFSLDFENREWVIKTLDVSDIFLGGNDVFSNSPNFNQLDDDIRRFVQ